MHRLSLYGALVALLLALAPVSASPASSTSSAWASPDLVTVRGDCTRQADLFIVDDLTARRGRSIGDKEPGSPRTSRRLRSTSTRSGTLTYASWSSRMPSTARRPSTRSARP